MSYASVVIVAILIHIILNNEYFSNKYEKTSANQAFKKYISAAFLYYIADACWGIIYEWHKPYLLYADTILYYLAMALTIVLLCRYVTTYLRMTSGFGRFIMSFGHIFGIFEIVILFINHFTPIFFRIDAQGEYTAYLLRYIALYIQVFLCALLAIQTGFAFRKSLGEMKKRYFTIFMFCIEMMAAIIVQIMYPLLPLYSIGLVLGIGIIHTFVEEGEKQARYNVLLSMADIHYSMHEIDLVNDTVEEFSARNDVKEIVNRQDGAREMMVQVMSATTDDEYVERALEFTNLDTVAERMEGKKSISAQFIGKNTGWFLAMFIATEVDSEGRPTKVLYTTRVIDEEKKQEEKLIKTSTTDELTGAYNRRAYDDDIYAMANIPDEFVYIAMDVNGLKAVNDSIGHAAGDEMIVGACDCMKKAFGQYGKIYRTGGDEFVVTVFISEDRLKEVLAEFDEIVDEWSGNLIDNLSVSYGYVTREECPDLDAHQIAIEADKRMYQAKSMYYRKKGVDRRGQQDAHKALSSMYTKILKVNLTDDSYQIVNMVDDEKEISKGFSPQISTWLYDFAHSGHVHEDDLKEYLEKTNIEYMKEYFRFGGGELVIIYRRRIGEEYKRVMMEIIPANDYSHEEQNVFLYVKKIEK